MFKFFIRSTFFILTIFTTITISAQEIQEEYKLVRVSLEKIKLEDIARLGLEADHGFMAPGRYWMNYLSMEERNLLTSKNIAFTLPLAAELEFLKTREDKCPITGIVNYPDPKNFRLGKMGGYYTLEEMNSILDSMHLLYPNIISSRNNIDTFKTIQGRPMQFIRISNNPNMDQNKPKVLFTALHHAREPMGLTQMIYFMWDLLENYNKNPEIKEMIDNSEIFFVPCVNPDGYAFNYANKPAGGGMWRKNRRLNPTGFFGVDLNRNYGITWGFDDSGSSPDQGSDTYRGSAAFSENETQALKFLIEQYPFALSLNYHTYGNYLIHPWSHIDEPCPDDATFKNIGRTYAQQNNFAIGTAQETVGYKTNGGSDDWAYAHDAGHKVFSMSPELGLQEEGFWPNISRIRDLAKTTLKGNQLYVKMAHRYFETTLLDPRFVLQHTENTFNVAVNRIGVSEGPVQWKLRVLTNNATLGQSNFILDLAISEQTVQQFKVTPISGAQEGELISIEFFKQMGAITEYDTLDFVVTGKKISTTDPCDDLSSVVKDGNISWGLDSETFYSAPTSFSDSPNKDYANDQSGGIVFKKVYNIPTEGTAILSCWINWDIEANFDYAQIYAITQDGNIPLCGRYTKTGTAFQDDGEPVYDGISANWLKEEIPLNDFAGQDINIGVRLVSDQLEVRNGFFIDDVEIAFYSETLNATNNMDDIYLSLYPNPATTELHIDSKDLYGSGNIVVKNSLGFDCIKMFNSDLSRSVLDVSQLSPGIYFIEIIRSNGQKLIKKWIRS